MKTAIRIQLNEAYEVRTEQLNGVDHLVIPVIMMKEGVHSGSHGAIYHRANDLGAYVEAWNGIPVTIGHPVDDGAGVSANSPSINEAWAVGTVYNANMQGDALHAEAWILPANLHRISTSAETMINNKEPMDVSVGVFSDSIDEPGTWNGESYTNIAINYRPDHLALLPHEQGACSWADGCGIRVNKSKDKTSINENEKDNEVMEIKTFKKEKDTYDPLQVNQDYTDRAHNIRNMLDGMDKDGSWHYLDSLFEDHFFYKVTGDNKPARYFRQAYSLDNNDQIQFDGDPVQVRKDVSFAPLQTNKKKLIRKDTKNNSTMDLKQKINTLITHSSKMWCAEDQEFLETLNESQIDTFVSRLPEEKPKTNEAKEEPKKEAPKNNSMTPEELIKALPQNVQQSISHGLKMYNDQKSKLIEVITNGAGEGVWTPEKLEAMEIEDLQNIAHPYMQANANGNEGFDFSLLGANRFEQKTPQNNSDDMDEEVLMPATYEKRKED